MTDREQRDAPTPSQVVGRSFWERGLHRIALGIHRFEELDPGARRRIAASVLLLLIGALGAVALFLFAV
jgi:hypothetical protein